MSTQAHDALQAFDYIAKIEVMDDRVIYWKDIRTFLDVYDQDGFSGTNFTLLSSIQLWRTSKLAFCLTYEMQSSYSIEACNEFRQPATVGLWNKNLQNILNAEIECHDPLLPDQAPFYLATTVHLGAMSHSEDWGDAANNHYLVLECASRLFWHKFANDKIHVHAPFKYQGHDYRYQVSGDRIKIYFASYRLWRELIVGVV